MAQNEKMRTHIEERTKLRKPLSPSRIRGLYGKAIRDERGIIGFEGKSYHPDDPVHSAELASGDSSILKTRGLIVEQDRRIPTRVVKGGRGHPSTELHKQMLKKKKPSKRNYSEGTIAMVKGGQNA